MANVSDTRVKNFTLGTRKHLSYNEPSAVKLCNEYLTRQKRRVIKIKQDGNCFYSAISFQLFGTQDQDIAVRNVIYRTITLNKNAFKPYLIPSSNIKTIEDLCQQNWKPGVWATQVEAIAAATVFCVPIFFISPSTEQMKWNVIHPLNNSSIRYPTFPDVDIDETSFLRPSHFELLYYQNYHYDAVVAMDTGTVCTDVPILTETKSELIILD